MKETTVEEGGIKLRIPDASKPEDGEVFYNPHMKSNRDITVELLNRRLKNFFALDALAGTGAKGLRIAKETSAEEVILNDGNPLAVDLIKRNIRLNKLKNCETSLMDANRFMAGYQRKADFVDIDPFGSPAPFTDTACRAIKKKGILALTATDTGALCGSFANAAKRRYNIRAQKTPFYNEFAVRALAGFAVTTAAKYELGMRVLFAHSTRHYLRVFLEAAPGAKKADAAIKKVRPLYYRASDGAFSYDELEGAMPLGPIWSGKIYEENIWDELDTEHPFYDMHILAKKARVGIVPFTKLKELLENAGFKFSRTHFNAHGFRSDASFAEVLSLLK